MGNLPQSLVMLLIQGAGVGFGLFFIIISFIVFALLILVNYFLVLLFGRGLSKLTALRKIQKPENILMRALPYILVSVAVYLFWIRALSVYFFESGMDRAVVFGDGFNFYLYVLSVFPHPWYSVVGNGFSTYRLPVDFYGIANMAGFVLLQTALVLSGDAYTTNWKMMGKLKLKRAFANFFLLIFLITIIKLLVFVFHPIMHFLFLLNKLFNLPVAWSLWMNITVQAVLPFLVIFWFLKWRCVTGMGNSQENAHN